MFAMESHREKELLASNHQHSRGSSFGSGYYWGDWYDEIIGPELAAQISDDYRDKGDIVLIGVLKGAFIFLADLSRRLTIPRTIEFIAVSSYDSGSVSSGAVRLVMDVRGNIEHRHVLIIEDIVDTGLTLTTLRKMIMDRGAASVSTAALLDKARRRVTEVPVEYRGFEVGDEFLIGYGLDDFEFAVGMRFVGHV